MRFIIEWKHFGKIILKCFLLGYLANNPLDKYNTDFPNPTAFSSRNNLIYSYLPTL